MIKMKTKNLKKQLIGQFYHKNIPAFTLAILAAVVGGSLNLILSWIIKQLIDTAAGEANALPLLTLLKISGGFLLLCALAFLLRYLSLPFYIRRAMCQYKEFALQKLLGKSISSFRDESTATYLSALSNDATSIETDYLEQQFDLLTKVLTFVGALTLMLWYSPLLTLIAFAITLLPLAASILTGNKLTPVEKKVSSANANFTAALNECLSGFSVIKSFQAEKEIFNFFVRSNRELEDKKFSKRRLKTLVGMIGALAGIFAQLGVFIAGTWLVLSTHSLTGGTVILFVNLMNFVIDPIATLPGLLASRRAAKGLMGKLAEALEKNPTAEGHRDISELKEGLRLDKLSFAYEEGKDVLHQLSANFEAGKAYAVVGGSGSGKSTLLHLLMAGNTGYQGQIFFDDTELRDLSTSSLYHLISTIQQNVFVFNASIRDNVTMFRDFPQAELDKAIHSAHLDELIERRGEDSLCGENGNALSGGEKQRISIARSLLKQTKLLLADEATSSLDAQTAHQVTSDILDLQGITRIIVTHTLEEALMKRYDGILVLKDGRIEESGRFEDLMAARGYFYALFTLAQ